MKTQLVLLFVISIFVFACAPYKEFEKTPEHERRVAEVRRQRYKDHSFVGKWQEFKRVGKNRLIRFQDTMRYDFFLDSTVNIYDQFGRMKRAQSGKVKKGFYIGRDNVYKDFYMRDGVMRFRKGRTTYYLHKVDRFNFGRPAKIEPKHESGSVGILDAMFLQGTWKIYKKTDPAFDRQKTYLHKLEIGESHLNGSYDIKAFFNVAGELVSDNGTMMVESKSILLSVMNQKKRYTVVSTEEDELVLKDKEVVYFLKRISK